MGNQKSSTTCSDSGPLNLKKSTNQEKNSLVLFGTRSSGRTTLSKRIGMVLNEGAVEFDDFEVLAAFRKSIAHFLAFSSSYKDSTQSSNFRDLCIRDVFDSDELSTMASAFEKEKHLLLQPLWTWCNSANEECTELKFLHERGDEILRGSISIGPEEAIRAHVRTDGPLAHSYFEDKLLVWDIGALRGATRRKAFRAVIEAGCIVFSFALSGFFQCLYEDPDMNAGKEQFALLEQFMQAKFTKNIQVLVMCNQWDSYLSHFQRDARQAVAHICKVFNCSYEVESRLNSFEVALDLLAFLFSSQLSAIERFMDVHLITVNLLNPLSSTIAVQTMFSILRESLHVPIPPIKCESSLKSQVELPHFKLIFHHITDGRGWSKELHSILPKELRTSIFALLCCHVRLRNDNAFGSIPKDVLFEIIRFMVHDYKFTKRGVKIYDETEIDTQFKRTFEI